MQLLGFHAISYRDCSMTTIRVSSIYQPLPLDHIRIIRLWADQTELDTLRATFEIHHKDELPKYDALSYTWGRPDASKTIYMETDGCPDATPINISIHLYQGLKTFVNLPLSALLWVDYLCINQIDIAEKEIQIPLMPLIYGEADKTVVWLGDARTLNTGATLSPSIFRYLMRTIKRVADGDERLEDSFENQADIWTQLFAAMTELADNPWYDRVWILQEVILAKHIIFLHGSNMIAFADLLELLERIFPPAGDDHVPRQIESSPRYDILSIRRRSTFLTQLEALRSRYAWRKFIRCQDAIEIVQRAQVTLEVDRVYGILGIIDPQVASRIPVEYDIQDYYQVWLRLARESLLEDHTLSLLSRVSPKHHAEGLPSWCPSFAPVEPSGEVYIHSGYRAGVGKQENEECCVSIVNDRLISLMGFRVGLVDFVYEVDEHNLLTFDLYLILVERQDYAALKDGIETSERSLYAHFSERLQYTYRWLQAAEALVRSSLIERKVEHEFEDAMSRVLIRDWTTHRFVDWSEDPAQYTRGDFEKTRYPACSSVVKGYRLVRSLIEDAACIVDTSDDVLNHIVAKYAGLPHRDQQVVELYLDSLAATEHQALFSCSNGLIGMSCGSTEAGDIVCVLYGGEPVYVLRDADSGSHFTLVGEGYARWCMELDTIPADLMGNDEELILG